MAARLQTLDLAIDRTAISKIEAGTRPVTDMEIVAICQAPGIKVITLFPEEWLVNRAWRLLPEPSPAHFHSYQACSYQGHHLRRRTWDEASADIARDFVRADNVT